MSIYRDPSGRWRFEFSRRIDGQRIRKRRLLPAGWTRTQAEAFDRAQSAALYAIASGIVKPRNHIDDAVRHYRRERAPALKAGANALREIDAMEDWWRGRFVDDLAAVCSEYSADQAAVLAAATIKNRISYLRAACRWAWKRHQIGESDPGARVVTPTVSNSRDVAVTRRDMLRLSRACRHRGVRALIRIAYYTGMRVGEIQRAQRLPGAFVLPDTKNGQPRIVPALPVIRTAMALPMPRRPEIDYWWPLAREACGLEHVHLHDLRHAAASAMVTAGIDLGTVGAVLGHKSASSTKRYAHYGTTRMAEALATIGRKVTPGRK